MHRLRQLIGNDEAVQVVDGKVSLDARRCWVDVRAFEHSLESSDLNGEKKRSAIRDQKSEITLRLERALRLYRGHFLSGEDGPWSVSARERLREKYLRAVIMLGEARERERDFKAAIASYEQALDVDDLAEELYRRLMACHQKLRRKSEAVKAYERCRRTLAAGLCVEPSEETEALYRSLMRK